MVGSGKWLEGVRKEALWVFLFALSLSLSASGNISECSHSRHQAVSGHQLPISKLSREGKTYLETHIHKCGEFNYF